MRSAVVGLGLIGGSAALALGARGWDLDERARELARGRGIDAAETLEEGLAEADLVLLAVPTEQTPTLLARLAAMRPEALFSDCASLKVPVVKAADSLPAAVRFVGGHPMAGSGSLGLAGADPGLFRDRPWIVVPTARSDDGSVARLQELVVSLGAVPIILDADRHDAAMTRVSHLPHVVAAALALAATRPDPGSVRLAGPGLADTTRLAEMPEALLLELALADPAALAGAVDDIVEDLRGAARALRSCNQTAVRNFFRKAAAARRLIAPPSKP
jgi:prephenate dehydrogenase